MPPRASSLTRVPPRPLSRVIRRVLWLHDNKLCIYARRVSWREAACRAHVSFRVPSLHRRFYLRCDPSWSVRQCAAERDNAALTCAPLTQERMTALGTYYGPRVTCEVRARDACVNDNSENIIV